VLQKLQNAENDVINIAKSRSLGFFRMVKATGPINYRVSPFVVEFCGTLDGASGRQLTELEHSMPHWVVVGQDCVCDLAVRQRTASKKA
jgi:hypothetical protein